MNQLFNIYNHWIFKYDNVNKNVIIKIWYNNYNYNKFPINPTSDVLKVFLINFEGIINDSLSDFLYDLIKSGDIDNYIIAKQILNNYENKAVSMERI